MRRTHTHAGDVNLDLLRSYFAIVELGSLNRAAERLRVSQSTLTRQMQALEREAGGVLLERGPAGVAPTAAGHVLAERTRTLLAEFDEVLAEVRRRARGQSASLRVGYLQSAAACYLNPALAGVRKDHPEVRVTLRDLSPGEQMRALRAGEIDVALIGQTGALLAKEFYVRTLASLPVWVALPEDHAQAKARAVRLGDLRDALFVGAPEADVPGHRRWVSQVCRRAGFRARFTADAESLSHGLSLVVTEGAVSLLPDYVKRQPAPGVVFRALVDDPARWELMVAWQRGRSPAALKTLLAGLERAAAATG